MATGLVRRPPMRAHLAYLSYVLRHKWYVLLACRQTGCSLWRGLIHDLSKFLPSEWGPYARTFYALVGSKKQYSESDEFRVAWLHHQHRNTHHWNYWVQIDAPMGAGRAVRMPDRYVREMVADWIGAGLAQGKPDVLGWYLANEHKMLLHSDTRASVERLLGISDETAAAREREP